MNHTRYWFRDELLRTLLPWTSKDKLARISKDEKLVCFRNWIGNTGHQLVLAGILSPCGKLALGQSLLQVYRAESSKGQRPPMTWQVIGGCLLPAGHAAGAKLRSGSGFWFLVVAPPCWVTASPAQTSLQTCRWQLHLDSSCLWGIECGHDNFF